MKRLRSDSGGSDTSKEMVGKKAASDSGSAKGSVSSEEGVTRKTSVPSSEDMRKLEDRLEVIDRRQAEVEEGQSKVSWCLSSTLVDLVYTVCVQALIGYMYRLIHNMTQRVLCGGGEYTC